MQILEWQQDAGAELCFRFTDIKAENLPVSVSGTQPLFESFSSLLLSFKQYEAI